MKPARIAAKHCMDRAKAAHPGSDPITRIRVYGCALDLLLERLDDAIPDCECDAGRALMKSIHAERIALRKCKGEQE